MSESPKPVTETIEGFGQTLAKRVALEEFLVDFFAALAPGVTFLICALLAISVPAAAALGTIASHATFSGSAVMPALARSATVLSNLEVPGWVVLALALLLVSYVVGLLFYRLDPDKPDRHSWVRLSKSGSDGKTKYTERERIEKLAAAEEKDCVYPYPQMAEYIKSRGLDYLLPLAQPLGREGRRESKSHLTTLRVRLRFHAPERFGPLIRMESHIRLGSSMWYAARALIRLCLATMLITLAVSAVMRKPDPLLALMDPLLVLGLAYAIQRGIERSLHYQRLRELMTLYELAWTYFSQRPSLLSPPFHLEIAHAGESRQLGGFQKDET